MSYMSIAILCIIIGVLGYILNELYDTVMKTIDNLETIEMNMQQCMYKIKDYTDRLPVRRSEKHKDNKD
jgi:hypothetical protein